MMGGPGEGVCWGCGGRGQPKWWQRGRILPRVWGTSCYPWNGRRWPRGSKVESSARNISRVRAGGGRGVWMPCDVDVESPTGGASTLPWPMETSPGQVEPHHVSSNLTSRSSQELVNPKIWDSRGPDFRSPSPQKESPLCKWTDGIESKPPEFNMGIYAFVRKYNKQRDEVTCKLHTSLYPLLPAAPTILPASSCPGWFWGIQDSSSTWNGTPWRRELIPLEQTVTWLSKESDMTKRLTFVTCKTNWTWRVTVSEQRWNHILWKSRRLPWWSGG